MAKYKKGLIVLCFVAIYLVSTGMGEIMSTSGQNYYIQRHKYLRI
jgi:hypothetical protein